MGVAGRVIRLSRRLVAASHALTEGINERRFLAHAALADLLSRDMHLRECATPVDHLRQLVEAAHREMLPPSVYLPIWKSPLTSPVDRTSIRRPEQCTPYRHVRPHDPPRRVARSRPANPGC